jgi:hypothetical protein
MYLLLAILEPIREATSKGWSNIVFESNSKIIADVVQANHNVLSKLNSIIMSINLFLQYNSNFDIKFIKRQTNMTAHTS